MAVDWRERHGDGAEAEDGRGMWDEDRSGYHGRNDAATKVTGPT